MNTFIKKHLPLLHSDDNLRTLFPTEIFNVVYRRNKNLKELLTPSIFPTPCREKYSCVTGCNMCDICKNYMIFSSTFVCTVTGKKYYISGNFTCNSTNVMYLVEYINCIVLKQRKIVVRLLGNLILFAAIQFILMAT